MTIDDVVNVVTDARRAQQREKYRGRDVILELQADRDLERDLAAAMTRKLDRLAKAQALCWNARSRDEQRAYLMAVDKLEGNRG